MSNLRAIKAVSLLWLGSLLGAGFAFLTQVILARQFGPEKFGVFMAALMTVMVLTPLAGFGVSQFWLKVFGKEGWSAIRWLASSFRFVVYSTSFVVVVIGLWALIGPHDYLTRNILLLFSLYVFGQVATELVSAKFQLEERYFSFVVWQFMPHLIRLLLVVVFTGWLINWMTVQNIALMYGVVAIAIAIMASRQLVIMNKIQFKLKGHGENQNIQLNQVKPAVKTILEQAWPFGLAGVFVLVYMQSDIVLVKYLVGSEAAGKYSIAFSIMSAVYLLPAVIYQKFLLPKIHRWANHDRNRFYQVYRQGNVIMLFIGLIAMFMILSLSDWGVPVLYGAEYFESIKLLNILAFSAPVFFLASSIGSVLVTQDHMKRKVKYMGVVALINIALNFLLIPEYGAIGAAVATVISNLILLSLYYAASRKYVFVEFRGSR